MQIQSGSLLKLKYGAHDNRNLLLSYGFSTPNNPSDRFEFTFSLDVLMVRRICHLDVMHRLPTNLLLIPSTLKALPPPSAQPLIKQYAPDSPSELAGWQQAVLLKLGFTSSELSATSVPVGQHLGEEAFTPGGSSFNSGDSSWGDSRDAPGPAESSPRLYLRPPLTPAGNHDTPALQVVDPRLLAALRIMTRPSPERAPGAVGGRPAEDVHRSRICAASLGQLRDWRAVPLGEAHELLVLRVLTALCAALYTSMGTTLQQDRTLHRELEEALLAGLSPEGAVLEGLVPEGTVLAGLCPEGDAGSLLLDPGSKLLESFDRMPPSSAGSVNGDVLMAVQYRISIKRCLEGALQAVLSRTRGEGHVGVRGMRR